IIVNDIGQVYSFNEEITKDQLPKPILDTINQIFGEEKITKASRGEFEYYQFDEQSLTGEPLIVKMRPNGDILEVRNDKATQEDQAMTANHKTSAAKKAAKG